MAEYFDYFNRMTESGMGFYGLNLILNLIGTSFQLYLLAKILKKNIWPPFYFLFAVCAVMINEFVPVRTLAGFGVFVLLFTAYGMFACYADAKSALLYAALTIEIMQLCFGIGETMMNLCGPWMPAVFRDPDGAAAMLARGAASLVLSGLCYGVVYRCFSWDVLYPRDVSDSFSAAADMQQMFLTLIPILMIFMMNEYISMLAFEFQFEVLMEEGPAGYLISQGQLLAMYVLGLAGLFCILFSYKKLQQNFRLSTELSLLEQEEHSLNQYVEEAKARYDETKSFRHDIRNHIAVVKNLLQGGKLEEAVNYMEDLDDMAEKMSFPCSTNNPVVDILAGNKLGLAKSMGIGVSCSLFLPYPCGLRDIDICIVLSNALDNAIHACKSMGTETEKFIHVSGRIQGDFLMLEIRNSFHGNGAFKNGTGLSNVKKVAEKYGGAMSIETQEKVFILHVLLIIPGDQGEMP